MEPGAKLFQPIGGRPYRPTEAQDREFLNALCTVTPFSERFMRRMPDKWQEAISELSPKVGPDGSRVTLDFIGDVFEISKDD